MTHPFLKSPQGEDPVIVEAEFSASADRLFKAWTTPDDIKKWFGAGEDKLATALVELEVGGAWQFVFQREGGETDSLSGKYLKIEQDKRLEFTWIHTRTLSDGNSETSAESVVTVTFEPRADGSFSRLVHNAIQAESSRANIGGGWDASFSKIKALVE